MIKNTFYLIVLAGLWMAHSTWAAPLEAGHYMLYSPVLYNYRDGEVWNAISYLRRENEKTAKLRVLMKEDVTLTINSTGDDRVAVEGWARMGAAQVLVEGEGKLISRNTVKGSLTKKYGHLPFEVTIKKGQWYLRPATEREIMRSVIDKLNSPVAPSVMDELGGYSVYKELTKLDTPEKNTFLEGRLRFLEIDIGKIKSMIKSGELDYSPKKSEFYFSNPSYMNSLSNNHESSPISSDVEVEHQKLTVEELMERGVIDEDTPPEKVEEIREELRKGQAALEQERREREAPISPEVDTYNINIPLMVGLIILFMASGFATWSVIRRRRR